MKGLSKTQQELLEAMRQGVVVFYMPNMGSMNQSPYYFRGDTMQRCTAAAYGLRAKGGYVEVYDNDWSGHKLRAKDDKKREAP